MSFNNNLFFLDIFFFIFHISIIFLNIIAPFFRKLRNLAMITQVLTLMSWFGLGLFYGIGYCPITDLHWLIKGKLGQTNLPHSFIEYLINSITCFDLSPGIINIITIICFFSATFYNIKKLSNR